MKRVIVAAAVLLGCGGTKTGPATVSAPEVTPPVASAGTNFTSGTNAQTGR